MTWSVAMNCECPRGSAGLRLRLATASLLVPLTLLWVLLPTPLFALGGAMVIGLAAWEWAGFVGLTRTMARLAYVGLVLTSLCCWWIGAPRQWDAYLLLLVLIGWLILGWSLLRIRSITPAPATQPTLVPVGVFVLAAPWLALAHLHGQSDGGPMIVLALLMLVWIADSTAYFVGRRWGRRRLAAVLSPGKTWAGLYGALVGATAWGLVLSLLMGLPLGEGLMLIAICALTAVLSVVGDLYESLLKRRRGLKDAGALLPGHGGILDRIDSTTAAAPAFVLGVLWLGGGF